MVNLPLDYFLQILLSCFLKNTFHIKTIRKGIVIIGLGESHPCYIRSIFRLSLSPIFPSKNSKLILGKNQLGAHIERCEINPEVQSCTHFSL